MQHLTPEERFLLQTAIDDTINLYLKQIKDYTSDKDIVAGSNELVIKYQSLKKKVLEGVDEK